eukprot:662385-Alexandrium_andersonii.AAC.1
MQIQPGGVPYEYAQQPAPAQVPGATQTYVPPAAGQQPRAPRGQQPAHGQQGTGGAGQTWPGGGR